RGISSCAPVRMGTLMSEIDDTSILRRRRTARHHYFLGAQAPTAHTGVRPRRRLSRSDLVLWRISEVSLAVTEVRTRSISRLNRIGSPCAQPHVLAITSTTPPS